MDEYKIAAAQRYRRHKAAMIKEQVDRIEHARMAILRENGLPDNHIVVVSAHKRIESILEQHSADEISHTNWILQCWVRHKSGDTGDTVWKTALILDTLDDDDDVIDVDRKWHAYFKTLFGWDWHGISTKCNLGVFSAKKGGQSQIPRGIGLPHNCFIQLLDRMQMQDHAVVRLEPLRSQYFPCLGAVVNPDLSGQSGIHTKVEDSLVEQHDMAEGVCRGFLVDVPSLLSSTDIVNVRLLPLMTGTLSTSHLKDPKDLQVCLEKHIILCLGQVVVEPSSGQGYIVSMLKNDQGHIGYACRIRGRTAVIDFDSQSNVSVSEAHAMSSRTRINMILAYNPPTEDYSLPSPG